MGTDHSDSTGEEDEGVREEERTGGERGEGGKVDRWREFKRRIEEYLELRRRWR